MARVVVLGATSREISIDVSSYPKVDHLVEASHYRERTSGRGARQAVACARLKAQVSLISAVGTDGSERPVMTDLEQEKVHTRGVKVIRGGHTSLEVTLNLSFGGYGKVLYPGVSHMLSPQHVLEQGKLFEGAHCALFQLELKPETVLEGMRCAKRAGCLVLLDPYPPANLPDELWPLVDLVMPNAEELARLSQKDDPDEGARRIINWGAQAVVAHLGPLGAIVYSKGSRPRSLQAFRVDTEDHSGAGDAFAAGMAVALAEGKDIEEAARFACAAGALACTRKGTMDSFPIREEVEALLRAQPRPGSSI
ncbi:sugar kinase, ribokinase [Thermanaerovibrio velox DSM 12556]|uniref:Ribokinase n=1 Tax=Thermanaerovibrio velox DSM 12556 TaxID=926567 RepID=H0UMT5_9BACT|nr:PfkB family carbohydrate kinase [Thermanaerovibrio velox]EHM09230.1 sugar kinase, ribokinase [Thermanaerovibrio velox DSM 12556]